MSRRKRRLLRHAGRRYLWDPQTSKVFADPKSRAGWPHLVGRLVDGRMEPLSALPCVFAVLKKALASRKQELRELFDEVSSPAA